jgi:prepilin-type N-terminal cleavage/methylation domain-containing protein
MKNHRTTGFTLVEILVVIAIIGLLAVIGIVSLGSARAKARDARRISDVRAITKALDLYFAAKQQYPVGGGVDMGGGCISEAKGVEESCTATDADVILLQPIPKSPNYDQGHSDRYFYNGYVEETLAGTPTKCTSGVCRSYGIEFRLESTVSGIVAGEHCWSKDGIFPSPNQTGVCPS